MNDRLRRLLAVGSIVVVVIVGVVLTVAEPGRTADAVSESRSLSGFDQIRLGGAFKTDITAGSSRTSVVLRADRDVIGRITTEVKDRTLFVGMRSGSSSFGESPRLEIMLPVLRGIHNDGAGAITVRGLNGGDFEIECSGAASILASGRAARETITLDGTGKIDATDVEAHDVTVDNNGLGSIRVRASGTLTMNVNGIGEIRYTGDPTHVESHVNGIGHIGRL